MNTQDKQGNILKKGDKVSCLYGTMVVKHIATEEEAKALGSQLLLLVRTYNPQAYEFVNANQVTKLNTEVTP